MQKNYFLVLLFFSLVSFADTGIAFKENKNQWPSNVLFGADYKSTRFFVNNNGFNFCVYNGNDIYKAHQAKHNEKNESNSISKQLINGHNYNVIFNNASFLNASACLSNILVFLTISTWSLLKPNFLFWINISWL